MPDPSITVRGHITVLEAELPALRPLLDEHIRLTRAEPGCLVFEVAPDPDDATRLDVFERFRDRAAFEAHQRRTAASAWGVATRHLTRHFSVSEGA